MLAFPSCIKDTYIPDRTGGDGESIILDIASETLPLMKSEASGAEIAVDHLDVLIFEENGAYRMARAHHLPERQPRGNRNALCET